MKKNANKNEAENSATGLRRNFLSWASANFITKALGYVRDAALVAVFGAGQLTDAYYAAFRITNLFRRTIGEGGLNAVFIPGFAVERNKGGSQASEFTNRFFTATLLGSAIIVASAILLRKQLTFITSAGFPAELFAFTALLTAIFAPHFLFVNLSAFFTALLNSSNNFFLASISQAAFSVFVIAAILLYKFDCFGSLPPAQGLIIIAAAVSISGLVQILALLPALKKENFTIKLLSINKSLKVFPLVIAALPATAVLAQEQLAFVLDTAFASFLSEGSITAIYNASRLIQFPISLFAAGAAATALPYLSRFAAEKNNTAFNAHLYRAIFSAEILLMPAACGLAAIAFPLCSLLFEHGNFTNLQTKITALSLIAACSSLPAFGLNKIIASAMYASGDKKMPLLITAMQLAINAALCFYIGKNSAHGLLTATSISAIFASTMFLAIMYKRSKLKILNIALIKIIFCAGLAGITALLFNFLFENDLAIVALSIPAAIIVYMLALNYLNITERHLIFGRRPL